MIFWPFFISFIIGWIALVSTSFEVKVCTCAYQTEMAHSNRGYESSLSNLRFQGGNQFFSQGHPVAGDYLCDNVLKFYITLLLCIEVSLTLLHFLVVIFHYYYNLLVIKWRPVNYIDDQLNLIQLKEQRMSEYGGLIQY